MWTSLKPTLALAPIPQSLSLSLCHSYFAETSCCTFDDCFAIQKLYELLPHFHSCQLSRKPFSFLFYVTLYRIVPAMMNRNRFANNERRLPQFRVSRKSSSGREEPVWPVLAKFHRFGNILFIFVKWLRFYSVFGKFFNLLWKIVMLRAGFQHGQILKNNIAIWSHWEELTFHFFIFFSFQNTDRPIDSVTLLGNL